MGSLNQSNHILFRVSLFLFVYVVFFFFTVFLPSMSHCISFCIFSTPLFSVLTVFLFPLSHFVLSTFCHIVLHFVFVFVSLIATVSLSIFINLFRSATGFLSVFIILFCSVNVSDLFYLCPAVYWGCRIHRLHHCRGVRRPHQRMFWI